RSLPAWNERRRAIAGRYTKGLLAAAAARGGPGITLPEEMPWGRHVFHLYPVRFPSREKVREALRERGIDTGLHYPVPIHLQPAYASMGLKEGSFPQAERAAREVLTLPIYPALTDALVDRVCEAVREVAAGR